MSTLKAFLYSEQSDKPSCASPTPYSSTYLCPRDADDPPFLLLPARGGIVMRASFVSAAGSEELESVPACVPALRAGSVLGERGQFDEPGVRFAAASREPHRVRR